MTDRTVVGIAAACDGEASAELICVCCDDRTVFSWWPTRRDGTPGWWEELEPVPGTLAARQAHRADDADSGTEPDPGR